MVISYGLSKQTSLSIYKHASDEKRTYNRIRIFCGLHINLNRFYDLSYLLPNYRSAFLNVSMSTYYSDLNGNRNLINGFRMLLSIEVKENAHI